MSVHTEARHTEIRGRGMKQEKDVTTTTTIEGSQAGGKSYAEVAGANKNASSSSASKQRSASSRRASFSEQAQQLIPNVSKQQLAYGVPILLAILLSLALLGFKSSYFHPAPPPTYTQQFANKVDSLAHTVGGDYYEAIKHRANDLSSSAAELVDSISSHANVESIKVKANELKNGVDETYNSAAHKANEYTDAAKKAGAKAGAKAGVKVDNMKENGNDAYARANLHGAGVGETVRHAVNEAAEAVRHAAAETQEAIRHKSATVTNTAQHKVQDVKESVHSIKHTIKEKL